MTVTIRRLGPGDESVLELLAKLDADFDLDGRGSSLQPLDHAAAQRFLANTAVLLWIAVADDVVVGLLYCLVVPLRSEQGQELLLYEIGVRSSWRKAGVGRALLNQMEDWMCTNGINVVWVLADNPIAVDFYRACDFLIESEQPVYMTRDVTGAVD
jgi:GNAT superfamily N-acetyltransferase